MPLRRNAFTMIELIFVIVILGILAAVAVPKLAATRNDAKVAQKAENSKVCINDLGSAYTATGIMPDPSTYKACVSANDCFNFLMNTPISGTLRVTQNGAGDSVCDALHIIGARLITDHVYGGTPVIY